MFVAKTYHPGPNRLCYVADSPNTVVSSVCLQPDNRTHNDTWVSVLNDRIHILDTEFTQLGTYIYSVYEEGSLTKVLKATIT